MKRRTVGEVFLYTNRVITVATLNAPLTAGFVAASRLPDLPTSSLGRADIHSSATLKTNKTNRNNYHALPLLLRPIVLKVLVCTPNADLSKRSIPIISMSLVYPAK